MLGLVLVSSLVGVTGSSWSSAPYLPKDGGELLGVMEFASPVTVVRVYATPQIADMKMGDSPREEILVAEMRRAIPARSKFGVGVPMTEVPASFIGPGGLVDFRIVGEGPAGENLGRFATRRGVQTENGRQWVDPLEVMPDATASRVPGHFPRIDAGSPAGRALADGEIEDEGIDGSAYGDVGGDSASPCRYSPRSDAVTPLWATVATTYPMGESSARLETNSSATGRFGAAYTVGAGWSASGARTISSSSSWGWIAPDYYDARAYWLEIAYRQYRFDCLVGGNPGIPSTQYWAWYGDYSLPQYQTGGTFTYTGLVSRPGWNTYCSPVSNGTWYRTRTDGRSYSWASGVKSKWWFGFDMMSEKNYSNAHKLVYQIRSPRNNKKLCGSNGYPAVASKLIERWAG